MGGLTVRSCPGNDDGGGGGGKYDAVTKGGSSFRIDDSADRRPGMSCESILSSKRKTGVFIVREWLDIHCQLCSALEEGGSNVKY